MHHGRCTIIGAGVMGSGIAQVTATVAAGHVGRKSGRGVFDY